MTYAQWLSELKEFRTGLFGWLLIVLTAITLPVFVVVGLRIFPDGAYPRFMLIAPGAFLAAVLFFVLSPIAYKLDSRKQTGTRD